MSDPGAVRYALDGNIATITFDRPAARNAMTWDMYQQLAAAVAQLETDNPRVGILRGAGGTFVSGTDIAQFQAFASADDGVRYERLLDAVISLLEAGAVPTIAVCEGNAAGAGLLIAAACDLRICTEDARFSAPIGRTVGNALSAASLARLIAHFGPSRTKALVMAGDALGAVTARAIGFVHDVVPAEDLDRCVADVAQRMASLAPLTLRATRRTVARILAAAARADDEDILGEIYGSRDFHEGVRAFLDKRPPEWSGQ